jgi:hypothetical protein
MKVKDQVRRSILYAIIFVLFVGCAATIITYAAGYKIDISQKSILQTGLISVQTKTQNSKIYVDENLVGADGVTLRNLEPKDYSIVVKADGFNDWSKKVDLQPGEATIVSDIILFRLNPKVVEDNSSITPSNLPDLSDTQNLYSSSGEIYANGNFVTRLNNNPTGLSWYADRGYIAFSYNGKLMMIQTDGSNLVEITDKTSDSPVIFTSSGKYMIYENDGKIYKAEIR